jgi:cobalt-zinc-cadmium efflux system membrane fusion protein
MNWKHPLSLVAVLALGAAAYYLVESGHDHSASSGHGDHGHAHGAHGHGAPAEPAEAKGPHLGRLLRDGDFTLELAIFERGTPPEFRAWFRQAGKPLPPSAVQLTVQLTRPGGKIDEHRFTPSGDFVRSPDEVY